MSRPCVRQLDAKLLAFLHINSLIIRAVYASEWEKNLCEAWEDFFNCFIQQKNGGVEVMFPCFRDE